jgi:hypothetical protein
MTEPRDQNPFADRTPPRELQDRVARTLHRDGLVEPRAVRLRRTTSRAALGLGLVALAFFAGRFQRPAPVDGRPEFLLLLYEDSTYQDNRPIREIVAEYAGWADSLRQERALVLGEKLGVEHLELPERVGQPAEGLPTGMFIVHANDIGSARSIASTSPHIRQGGRIVVHAIDH